MLQVGDPCVCGAQYGKVRALFNSRSQRVTEATPALPVEVLGLKACLPPVMRWWSLVMKFKRVKSPNIDKGSNDLQPSR